MRLKCKHCGNTERFIGWQSVNDGLRVYVNAEGDFVDELEDPHDLQRSLPEGPWQCDECNSEDVEDDEQ